MPHHPYAGVHSYLTSRGADTLAVARVRMRLHIFCVPCCFSALYSMETEMILPHYHAVSALII